MKRTLTFLLLFLTTSTLIFSQLRVYQNGNLGIFTQQSPLARIGINTTGQRFNMLDIDASKFTYGINIIRRGTSQYNPGHPWRIGVFSKSELTVDDWCFGMRAVAFPPDGISYIGSGRAIGIYGTAGGATNGYNYGVMGAISKPANQTGDGAGIFGVDHSDKINIGVTGRFAGYFVGNVQVTQGTFIGTIVQSSDVRFKENINELNSVKSTVKDRIQLLNPIEYNLIQEESLNMMKMSVDTTFVALSIDEPEALIYQKKHYGLIAQEVQKLYPDLVYEQDNGYLAVNYIEIIPLLIQSIKELNEENQQQNYLIRQLTNGQSLSKKGNVPQDDATSLGTNLTTEAILYQNTPNPFNQSTQINYYLPENITIAYLCIYDLHGKQLKQIKLNERGSSYQIISGSEFQAGIYLYALLADGKEIDVKRMILTD